MSININSIISAIATSDLEGRTTRPIGSRFRGQTPETLKAAMLAANWTEVQEPGVKAPAIAFESKLPFKGEYGLITYGALTPEAKASVRWLDPKGTEGTPCGGALPCVSGDVLAGRAMKTRRAIMLVGPGSFEPDAPTVFWTVFPQPRGYTTPDCQPTELRDDTLIKIIW